MKLNALSANDPVLHRATAHQDRKVSVRIVAVLAILAVTMVAPMSPAGAAGTAQAVTYHEIVPGAAEVYTSTCPWGDWVPDTDTYCDDWDVLYVLSGQPPDLREQPWVLQVLHGGSIVHPDGTVTSLFDTWGVLENPQGSFDLKEYKYAQVSGTVPMDDGSEIAVDLTWDMALAELHVDGNDGPLNQAAGIERHYADRCVTINFFAHQQWRGGAPGQISGWIDGVDIGSTYLRPPENPFIAGRSVFTGVWVTHGGCALE